MNEFFLVLAILLHNTLIRVLFLAFQNLEKNYKCKNFYSLLVYFADQGVRVSASKKNVRVTENLYFII